MTASTCDSLPHPYPPRNRSEPAQSGSSYGIGDAAEHTGESINFPERLSLRAHGSALRAARGQAPRSNLNGSRVAGTGLLRRSASHNDNRVGIGLSCGCVQIQKLQIPE